MNISLRGRDLLRLSDFTKDEIVHVLYTAKRQKLDWANGDRSAPLAGKAVAIIMEKPSLRTRVSFEIGTARLGAQPVVMADKNSAFSRGETVADTTLVLERMVDAIVIRTFEQRFVEEVAEYASIPVINALTDDFHPCQVLADLLTIFEHKGNLPGLNVAYVGDGNNMANTYLEGMALCGMNLNIATPEGYEPMSEVISHAQRLAQSSGSVIQIGHDPYEAVKDVDVVITDTWASMGSEDEHDERVSIFTPYQVNEDLMSNAKQDAIFMHCLPAHRGEEVTDQVMDGTHSVIYDEAENRLHVQKALLSLVLEPEEA